MEKTGIPRGEKFKLSTAGSPLTITVGTPANKSDRVQLKNLSYSMVMEFVNSLELSKNQTKKFCSNYRSMQGCRSSIEGNISQKIDEIQAEMEEFFTVFEESFQNGNETVNRNVDCVKDKSGFLIS